MRPPSHASGLLVLLTGFLVLAAGGLVGCSREEPPADRDVALDLALASEVGKHYAVVLREVYADVVKGAEQLDGTVRVFTALPSESGLERCRLAWVGARPAYLQSEVARFYDGPIDRASDGPEGDLNPWPLDESYIDAVEGAPTGGFIGDPERVPLIDEAFVRRANGDGGEENIAAGWHAVEFMLWGQDRDPRGPGRRDWRDFADAGGLPHGERRRTYLRTLTRMIVADVSRVAAEWDADTGAYREEFLSVPPREQIRRILTGAGTLAKGELYGERMLVPYTSKAQEDEHSCFSDTTHLDHLHDLLGIVWVWTGRWTSPLDGRVVEGPGLRALAMKRDPDLAKRIDAHLARAEASLRDPHFQPFDRAIQGLDTDPGRACVREVLSALQELDRDLSRLAAGFGLAIVTSLPG
ncbi:MAG: imelysin family protein [Planctomycetota bacterium]